MTAHNIVIFYFLLFHHDKKSIFPQTPHFLGKRDFSVGKADDTGSREPRAGKSPAFVLCLVRHRKSVMIFPGAWPAAGTALG